ncbi:hypothetical protein WK55_21810 [Burkholderia ubonensis]|nr:hypothetical protein WK55_21810 [Burkholderia ubonensis]
MASGYRVRHRQSRAEGRDATAVSFVMQRDLLVGATRLAGCRDARVAGFDREAGSRVRVPGQGIH